MTENIFEIETTALVHVVCAPQKSGVFLTDVAAAHPSVSHSWVFSVLDNTWLPDFLSPASYQAFTGKALHVEIAGADRGQFLMARGVRHGCPASGNISSLFGAA